MSKNTRGRDVFARYKWLFCIMEKCFKLFPMRMRVSLLERNRNVRGKRGLGIRYVLIKSIAQRCGDNVAIYPGAYIYHPQNLLIGNNVSIHPMCYIECGSENGENLKIDDNVSIAHGVTIMTTTHLYADEGIPIKDQGAITKPVHIKSNVWIGAKTTILCGVTIESGCVIGANSVITTNTLADKVYGGVPARILKDRVVKNS